MDEEREGTFQRPVRTVVGDLLACPTPDNESEDDAATGRLGGKYQFTDDVMVYAQFSTGYKSGGHATSNCDDPFDPRISRPSKSVSSQSCLMVV